MIRAESADLDRLVADLVDHPNRRTVIKTLRRELRRPLPAVRVVVKASAIATLPARGGLGQWVASTRIGASIRDRGDEITMDIRGGRSSATGKRSDIRAIDRGRVRAKAWGRSVWHRQTVPAGFFTRSVSAMPVWATAADIAAQAAAKELAGD